MIYFLRPGTAYFLNALPEYVCKTEKSFFRKRRTTPVSLFSALIPLPMGQQALPPALPLLLKLRTRAHRGTQSLRQKSISGGRNFDMEFYWVSADEISDLEIYPDNCKKFLLSHDGGLRHFIYKE